MTPTDIFNRAETARRLLDDDGFREVIADLRNEQVKAFLASEAHDQAAREEAHRMVRALDRIEQRLRGMVADLQSYQQQQDRHRGND